MATRCTAGVLSSSLRLTSAALQAAEGAVRAGIAAGGGAALPAPVFNLKKRFDYRCAVTGERRSVVAGRMECTMQARVLVLAPLLCTDL